MEDLLTIISTTVASVVEPLLDRYPVRRTPAASAGLSPMSSAVQYPVRGSALADNRAGALALPMMELPHNQRQVQPHQEHAREQEEHQQGQLQQQHHQQEQNHHGHQQQQYQHHQQQYQHYQTATAATTTTAAAAAMVHHGARRPVSGSGGYRRMGRRDGGSHDLVTDAYVFDHDHGDAEVYDERDDALLPAAASYEPGRSCVDLLLRLLGGCGATEKRINALPVVALHVDAYGEVADDSILFNQDTCSICLDGYDVCNTVRVLGCHHVYHAMCIDVWLRRRPTCPMCNLTCC